MVGLDEGRLPRRSQGSPFLDEEQKAELERSSRTGRLLRTDPVSRDRYLFYTACTRPTRRLYLVREAASDDGAPREPSPFWDETRGLFAPDEVERWTRRRPLAALTWPLEDAPSERERLRALASLAPADRPAATSLARANGWERRLDRALAAFDRPTRLTHPVVLEQLREKSTFAVTELERFTGCSSMWFVDRVLQPRSIDVEVDARLKGTIVHQALFTFFKGLPKRTGVDRVQPETLEDALVFLRECLADALVGARALRPARAGAQRARAGPRARPREADPPRGRVRVAARAEPLRGLVRLRALRARAAARARARRLRGHGQDRPDRPRPVRRPRDRRRLQVRPRADGPRDRPRAAPADPALHARPARPGRDGAARRRLPHAGRRRARARAAARGGARGRPAGVHAERLRRRGARSGAGSSARRSTPRASSSASARATCGTTRAAAPARPGASSGRCAG